MFYHSGNFLGELIRKKCCIYLCNNHIISICSAGNQTYISSLQEDIGRLWREMCRLWRKSEPKKLGSFVSSDERLWMQICGHGSRWWSSASCSFGCRRSLFRRWLRTSRERCPKVRLHRGTFHVTSTTQWICRFGWKRHRWGILVGANTIFLFVDMSLNFFFLNRCGLSRMVLNAFFLFGSECRILRKFISSTSLLPARPCTLLLCFEITNGVRLNSVSIFTSHYLHGKLQLILFVDAVLKRLQELSCGKTEWHLSKVLKTAMFGSGEKKTAWVFRAK